jgi:branched-subunit amino acid transport protein AzlD
VAQLQSIQSLPSVLESTSLVLVTGVDLFFTRVTPARHFDSLEPDFSYGLLAVALLALAVGVVVMYYYSKQSIVKQKWL